MVAPAALLAIGAGGGLLQGIFGASQDKTSQRLQQMSREMEEFNRQWVHEAEQRNMLRRYEAALGATLEARAKGNEFRALQEVYTKLAYDNQRSALSKQTQAVNGAMMSSFSGRGISDESGTARALLRTNLENASNNAKTLRQGERNTNRDIRTQYENLLSSLKIPEPGFSHFQPNNSAVASNATNIFLSSLAQGAFSGASAYIQAS